MYDISYRALYYAPEYMLQKLLLQKVICTIILMMTSEILLLQTMLKIYDAIRDSYLISLTFINPASTLSHLGSTL